MENCKFFRCATSGMFYYTTHLLHMTSLTLIEENSWHVDIL